MEKVSAYLRVLCGQTTNAERFALMEDPTLLRLARTLVPCRERLSSPLAVGSPSVPSFHWPMGQTGTGSIRRALRAHPLMSQRVTLTFGS